MLESFIQLILSFSEGMGYWGIILLMTIESSFIPFPSEVVIPPAAYLAQTGVMNIYLVVAAGIFGSLLGASINYFLAMTLGRTIVYRIANHKLARLLLIDESKIKKSEDFFLKYGRVSTFTGRLIPVIRQLISIPAGFSKMNFFSFLFYTFIGSGIWIVVLAILGYVLGSNSDLLKEYYHVVKNLIWFAFFILVAILTVKFLRKRKNKD